jgi:FkbM family methyltransferase
MADVVAMLGRLNRGKVWRSAVRVAGLTLTPPSLDRLLYLWLHRCGLMGGEEWRLLRALVRPGMRVIDVGANVGLYSLLLSRLTGGSGHVVAFEPEPELFAALRANCLANAAGNVTAVNCALGAAPGRAVFYRNAFNSGDNRLGGLGWRAEGVEVEVARLDDVHRGGADLIKMDVQGYELGVLRGMDRLVAANPGVEVYFEFWPHGLRAAGTDPREVLGHLRSRGFRVLLPEGGGLTEVGDDESLLAGLPGKKFTNLLASRTRQAGPIRATEGGLPCA